MRGPTMKGDFMKNHKFWAYAGLFCMAMAIFTGSKRGK